MVLPGLSLPWWGGGTILFTNVIPLNASNKPVISFVVTTESERFDASGGVSLTRGRPPPWRRS